MVDVVISWSRENEATARQLAEAVGREGLKVWWDEAPSDDPKRADVVSDRISEAKAAIVIWSRASVGSEWVKAEANMARGQKKLIQVSADGATPPVPFDPAQVEGISTWLGAADDEDWLNVRARLAALTGLAPVAAPPSEKTVRHDDFMEDPEPAPVAPPTPPAPVTPLDPDSLPPEALTSLRQPPPKPSAAASVSGAPRLNKGLVLTLVAIVGLLAAAAGAYVWMQGGLGGSPEIASLNEAAAPPTPAPPPPAPAAPDPTDKLTDIPGAEPVAAEPPPDENFDRQAVIAAGTGTVRSAPSALGITVARIAPGEAFSTYQQQGEWWRVRTANGTTGYLSQASIRLREPVATATASAAPTPRPKARPAAPRVRYKYSENMQLFCEGAGAGTRECRAFRRNTRRR